MDQIKLWEMETNRMRTIPGFLYEQFLRQEDYNEVLKFAYDYGYVVWKSDSKRLLVVSEDGHENVKSFMRQKSR
jgi:transcription initiation factor TFIIH subunit 4